MQEDTATATATAHDPRAWVAPLLSTLLTLPAAALALFYGGLSPMACDSCDGARADRFTDSFGGAWTVLRAGLVLSLVLLLVCWSLPWRQDRAARRAALSVGPPVLVGVAVVAFTGMVDWP
ncbi:hypothetical protein [Streptomyces nitrosporeus]|uniref:hypothetical protein n=1 Tax=Streptomyces nitrosporeus TaxID=28894 RepID=UPI0033341033